MAHKNTQGTKQKQLESKRKSAPRVSGKKIRKKRQNSELLRGSSQEQPIVQTYKDWLKKSRILRRELNAYRKETADKNKKTDVLLQEISKGIYASTEATKKEMRKLERVGCIEKTDRFRSTEKDTPVKKKRIETILFYSCLVSVVVVLSSVFTVQSETGVPKNIAGYAPMTILTRSMQRVYPQHSFVITKVVNPKTLGIGDDITYMKENNTTVTHRIIGINEMYMETGARGFETKGVENPRKDEEVVRAENVIGKVVFSNYPIGKSLLFVRENMVLIAVTGVGLLFFMDLLMKHIAIVIKK